MSSLFEQELRKLFEDGKIIRSPHFAGEACLGTLGKDLRVKAQFVTTGYADHYDALKLSVLNPGSGPVDTMLLKLKDVWGKKSVPNNPNFRNGISPHIWVDKGKAEWYAYQPTSEDRKQLCRKAAEYLEPFREAVREETQGGLKLVYICAPLRGDVEKNIEFARGKAKEVFQEGNIPICPHLMFPPFADPENPDQDQAARKMGLRLVEVCQQVNVYGTEWTEGMWNEIRHAMDLGIQVKTDRKEPEKTKLCRHQGEKER